MNPRRGRDADGEFVSWVMGSGILLIQAAAVIPGLLPILLLFLPFVLPLVLVGVIGAALAWVPVAVWRLGAWTFRQLIRWMHSSRVPAPETTSA